MACFYSGMKYIKTLVDTFVDFSFSVLVINECFCSNLYLVEQASVTLILILVPAGLPIYLNAICLKLFLWTSWLPV